MDPLQIAQDTSEPLQRVGAAYYFHPSTLARGKELGLDGFRFYVLGRGGVLGDVEPTVIEAAFGYFSPELINKMWTTAKERLDPRQAAREALGAAYRLGEEAFASVDADVLDGFNEAAAAAQQGAALGSLSLYAGFVGEPRPDGPAALAMHNAILLRELRGSVHLAAIAVAALEPAVAHAARRPDDVGTFGYPEPPVVTDEDRAELALVDVATDQSMARVYASLSDEQGRALVTGAQALQDALSG